MRVYLVKHMKHGWYEDFYTTKKSEAVKMANWQYHSREDGNWFREGILARDVEISKEGILDFLNNDTDWVLIQNGEWMK